MKKALLIWATAIGLSACTQHGESNQLLQNQIDSLHKQLSDAYKPGLGEFMSSIQVHHAKLWFAGQNQNWRLADFEIKEIMEDVEDIRKYETDRPETKQLTMLDPVIDSINSAIEQKDPTLFRRNFVLLTSTCNNCHRAVKFEFNVIQIPDAPPFSNQNFKSEQGK